jgi:hypothetical protein
MALPPAKAKGFFGELGRSEVDHLFDFLGITLWTTWGYGGEKANVKGIPRKILN